MQAKNRFRIGIDLDGTVYNFVDQFRLYVHNSTGKPMSEMPPANTWEFFSDQWGIPAKEYHSLMRKGVEDGEIFWKGEAFPNAIDTINKMYEERLDEIIFVTSRGAHGGLITQELALEATRSWLNSVGVNYDQLILTDNKDQLDLSILIDDAPYQIEKAIVAGQDAIIFDQLWNQHMTYVRQRAFGWDHVYTILQENYPVDVTKILFENTEW